MLRILAIIFKYDINFFMNFIWVSTMGKGLFFVAKIVSLVSTYLPLPLGLILTYFSSYRLPLVICSKLSFKGLPLFLIVVASDSLL